MTEQDDALLAGVLRSLLAGAYVGWPSDVDLTIDGTVTLTDEQAAAVARAVRAGGQS